MSKLASIKQISEYSGISYQHISRVLRGVVGASPYTVDAICRSSGVDRAGLAYAISLLESTPATEVTLSSCKQKPANIRLDLTRRRKKLKLSQQVCADVLGVGQITVSKIEGGKLVNGPTVARYEDLLDELEAA